MNVFKRSVWLSVLLSFPLYAAVDVTQLSQQVEQLKAETVAMEKKLERIQAQQVKPAHGRQHKASPKKKAKTPVTKAKNYEVKPVMVHIPTKHPDSLEFYPTVLSADGEVLTYIAGTPVVTTPYLGARPAFDGSDYIVNISSINRDLRLMQQRRNFYRGFKSQGDVPPKVPVIALSGKVEPLATIGRTYAGRSRSNVDLGSDEVDVAAILNEYVEAYMGIAYDASYPLDNGQRVANSGLSLNMGFVNIGNLEKYPFYFTAGQIFVPFGRYSTAMVSAPLPMIIARTKSRPFILGYKSQEKTGSILSLYGFTSDTIQGNSGIGGINYAYIFEVLKGSGEVGVGVISSMDDSSGMQNTGSTPGTTFGGFASLTNGTEAVKKIPGVDVHANISFDRFSLTAEWLTATASFPVQDLSFNGVGARPQAGQVEGGVTFRVLDKPSSVAVGYQWTQEALALNLPKNRISAVFNISVWKDTIESLEYRHDTDYAVTQYANGANALNFAPNVNTVGTGKAADTVLLQIGVFF
ncbi:MAG: LbtU family siderophore porin [Gammaproteobacteria bacterium]|nr:LbtU family siderophore porin [Gammaproteobacteria bacterium]